MKPIVLTGGPGSGKSTVLNLLHQQGYATGNDAARQIIRERKSRGDSPRPDPLTFAQTILEMEIQAYTKQDLSPAFYERGVVDAVGALCALYPSSAMDLSAAQRLLRDYPYHAVFIFPPWEDIYCMDDERDHTFDHAAMVYESTIALYTRFNYTPIEVPKDTPENRVRFILGYLER